MTRPCFLVVDREYSGSISTRKLVIETAKLNVITAYSAREAVEVLTRFPAVNGIVLDAGIGGMDCCVLIDKMKEISPKAVVILISLPGDKTCDLADYQLESFDPTRLLELLQKLDPYEAAAIDQQDILLKKKGD
jgi:DNA-binding NtrC family response regulator